MQYLKTHNFDKQFGLYLLFVLITLLKTLGNESADVFQQPLSFNGSGVMTPAVSNNPYQQPVTMGAQSAGYNSSVQCLQQPMQAWTDDLVDTVQVGLIQLYLI